jgi:nicotinamide-nucleotide amidase
VPPDSRPSQDLEPLAVQVVVRLRECGATLATAESLTGGLLAALITAVPGASAVFRGGIVAYASDLKADLLGVEEVLLAEQGPVHPDVARQMAAGVRRRLGADLGVATTGVAGPTEQSGRPVGTVWVGAADRRTVVAVDAASIGNRDAIRRATCHSALVTVLSRLVMEHPRPTPG